MSTDIPDLIAGALGVSRGTAYDMMREALAKQYAEKNSLGGPAKVFDAMADAIRAGDDYHAVLRQYGFVEAQKQEPVLCINPKVIDPATGKVRNGTGALTYSDTPCAGWSLPLFTSPPAQQQEPVAWHNKIVGMEVSMDVSTGEDDEYHRVFGRVCEVMLESCGADADTILVIEDSRNFTSPPASKPWAELSAEEMAALVKKYRDAPVALVAATEAKLREKNA